MRQLFAFSYTLALEKYFIKLCNKIMCYKNISFQLLYCATKNIKIAIFCKKIGNIIFDAE